MEVAVVSITVNLKYKGKNGSARKFVDEMISSGTVDAIREEKGNIKYEYYQSIEDPEMILLIDSWENQEAIDVHHASPMMKTIADLRRNVIFIICELSRCSSLYEAGVYFMGKTLVPVNMPCGIAQPTGLFRAYYY